MNTTIKIRNACLAVVLLAAIPFQAAWAQAYCALRDPSPQIYSLFPDATSYRSRVSEINEDTRRAVAAMLPFSLHTRELGQHTLYVAMAAKRPVGLVHVRSEPSSWGLVEIAWSIGMDRRIRDFRFQRCRGKECGAVDSAKVRQLFADKDLEQIRALLATDASGAVAQSLKDWAGADRRLVEVMARSAAKTLAVTQIVWPDQLQQVSAQR